MFISLTRKHSRTNHFNTQTQIINHQFNPQVISTTHTCNMFINSCINSMHIVSFCWNVIARLSSWADSLTNRDGSLTNQARMLAQLLKNSKSWFEPYRVCHDPSQTNEPQVFHPTLHTPQWQRCIDMVPELPNASTTISIIDTNPINLWLGQIIPHWHSSPQWTHRWISMIDKSPSLRNHHRRTPQPLWVWPMARMATLVTELTDSGR
jgi:hypothetical protein